MNRNGIAQDADEMAKAFTAALRKAGHTEVKAVFVYGPKLVSSFVEPTMTRGTGPKMAEPLVPLCDHRTWRQDRSGTWAECCPREAAHIQFANQEVVTVRCPEHLPGPDSQGNTPTLTPIRPAVVA